MAQPKLRKMDSLLEEMHSVQQRIMDRAYQLFTERGGQSGRALNDWLDAEREVTWSPPAGLREQDDHYVLEAAVPGIDPKDLEVCVTADDVLIQAETQHAHDGQDGTVCFCDFRPGKPHRSIHFPRPIDPKGVRANLKNGLLTVTAPVARTAKKKSVRVSVE